MSLRPSTSHLLLLAAPGLIALAWEPARWLARTWIDPAYGSVGLAVVALWVAVVARSVLSGPAARKPGLQGRALALVLCSALARLVGRLLAVRVIGAVALVLDVYALAIALGVERRPWALRPGGVALLFALSLPVEHLLQRLLGFPMRLASAAAAQWLLAPFAPGLTRHGALLVHPQLTLAVDLPCSGAQGLTLLAVLGLALACRRRARFLVWTLLAVPLGALIANTLRLALLFGGLRLGWPVEVEPAHSLVGLLALAVGALVVLLPARGRPIGPRPVEPRRGQRAISGRRSLLAAAGVSLLGLGVSAAPARPLDVGAPVRVPTLPLGLGRWVATPTPLSAQERIYFQRFGGRAEKAIYRGPQGTFTALVVTTSAPLRHLHGPDRCLLGAGHRVERLGVRRGAVPTLVWRSTGPDGSSWRVEISFVSQRGVVATSVSEVLWRWLSHREAWTLVERVSAWSTCSADPSPCRRFDEGLFRALELGPQASTREGEQ